jgi:acetolactate synthase-1/3 small subunit
MLELTVNHHPGVMSHICGLFSRRAFNVEGILCIPCDKRQSRIWLLVEAETEETRLIQMMKQLLKLEDVQDLQRYNAEPELFGQVARFFQSRRVEYDTGNQSG